MNDFPSLPAWLYELLPSDRPIQNLLVTDDQISITFPDGARESFDSLREADGRLCSTEFDTTITDKRSEPDELLGRGSVTYSTENGYTGVIFAYTDADRRASLQDDYKDSRKAIEAYLADPQDFAKAWTMIDQHPAFWTFMTGPKSPWYWNTSGYCSKIRQSVYTDKSGNPYIVLEAGGHVPTRQNFDTGEDDVNYTEHYGDWRLELSAPTFEEAIKKLAGRIAICFNPDGTDREGAYEILEDSKPEWIRDLEGQIADE